MQGDSLRWRWINLTGPDHPMHVHGFYFRADGVGSGAQYTAYAPDERRRAVTEVLPPGATMALAWSPNRAGNWIFHCHFVGYISHRVSLGTEMGVPETTGEHAHDGASALHAMAGLVLGIRVAPNDTISKPKLVYKPIHLLVRSKPNVYDDRPGYAYVLGGSPA